MTVVILKGCPGAEDRSVRWTDIDPKKRRRTGFIMIQHCLFHDEEFSTPPSRQNRYRARPFVVRDGWFNQLSAHKTLANAERAAREWAKNLKADAGEEV